MCFSGGESLVEQIGANISIFSYQFSTLLNNPKDKHKISLKPIVANSKDE